MITVAIQVMGAVVAAAAGRVGGVPVAAASTLSLVWLALAERREPLARPLFAWDGWAWMEPWAMLWPAAAVAGTAWPVVRASIWKRDALLVGVGLLGSYTAARAATEDWDTGRLKGRPDAKGICLQTSGVSCTAAAAVMFLHRWGVASTEREMAELCLTRMNEGTRVSGILRGLRRKLEPGARVDWGERPMDDLPLPSLVSIRWGSILHSVVLVERTAEGVVVLDPLAGRREWTRAEFERERQGPAFWAHRP